MRWLEAIDDRLHDRVARLGLVEPRQGKEAVTLGTLLERFEATSSVKKSTWAAYKQGVDSLRELLGESTPLVEINTVKADGWRKTIADSGLAPAPVPIAGAVSYFAMDPGRERPAKRPKRQRLLCVSACICVGGGQTV